MSDPLHKAIIGALLDGPMELGNGTSGSMTFASAAPIADRIVLALRDDAVVHALAEELVNLEWARSISITGPPEQSDEWAQDRVRCLLAGGAGETS